jgi:lipopolysaccharide/colanic/teichoic acid biosynthesis glycosyltransferase
MRNLVGVQGNRRLVIENGRAQNTFEGRRASISNLTGNESKGIVFIAGYFISEYVWANMMLMISFIFGTSASRSESRPVSRRLRAVIKRSVDIIGSLIGLILTAPLYVILPILIKLDSPGPVFYLQSRVGHNRRRGQRRVANGSNLGRVARDRRRYDLKGKPFRVIKFRTMVADAEKKCGPVWATENDPRITRLGQILRKTRLDEMPQFINVLLGQMSLVGPRPERPVFVKELSSQVENYDRRLEVKPGLTGLAQIENGYDSSVASVVRKVHYDLQYIQDWSIWQDFKIICRTVLVVITGKGAF